MKLDCGKKYAEPFSDDCVNKSNIAQPVRTKSSSTAASNGPGEASSSGSARNAGGSSGGSGGGGGSSGGGGNWWIAFPLSPYLLLGFFILLYILFLAADTIAGLLLEIFIQCNQSGGSRFCPVLESRDLRQPEDVEGISEIVVAGRSIGFIGAFHLPGLGTACGGSVNGGNCDGAVPHFNPLVKVRVKYKNEPWCSIMVDQNSTIGDIIQMLPVVQPVRITDVFGNVLEEVTVLGGNRFLLCMPTTSCDQ